MPDYRLKPGSHPLASTSGNPGAENRLTTATAAVQVQTVYSIFFDSSKAVPITDLGEWPVGAAIGRFIKASLLLMDLYGNRMAFNFSAYQ